MLESEPTHSLVAKLLQCSSLVVHANLVLKARNAVNEAMDRCETSLLDVMVSEAYQNDHSYVHKLRPTLDSIGKSLAWWAVTHKTVKIG